jgi:antirestriction protein ArdC
MPSPSEIRQQITQKIVEALEENTIPWRRPWMISKNAGRPSNVMSRRAYNGINILLLDLHRMKHDLRSRWFGTYRQWQALGAQVKKRPAHLMPGEWGCQIVLYRPLTKLMIDKQTGEEQEKEFRLLRTFTVFNIDQVEGTGVDHLRVVDEPGDALTAPADFEPAEQLIEATRAEIRLGGEQAYYRRPVPEDAWPNHEDGDYIAMPQRNRFPQLGLFYETLLHELAHWSEIRTGFDRRQGYAMGELVAEMSACFLSTELSVPNGECLDNHAAYLKSWLEAMKQDTSFIFRASSQASKTVDYLLSFVRQEEHQPTAVEAA